MKTNVISLVPVPLNIQFLPPHGRILPAGATLSFDGDLRTVLASGRNRYSRQTELTSMQKLIDMGYICIQQVDEEPCSSSLSSL